MKTHTLSLLLLTGLALTGAAMARSLPDFKASYKLEQHGLRIGSASIALHMDEQGRYRYEFRSWPNPWIAWFTSNELYESSRGEITATGVRPRQYHYQRSGDSERVANLAFDWQSMTVENDVAGSHWKMAIPAGTLDKLATQLDMMIALDQGRHDVSYTVADGGTLKEYRYRVTGKETLELPAGTFRTVRVARLRKDIDQETIIWFAPALHFLPVRIWRRDGDDEEYQSELEDFSRSLRDEENDR
ncbi:MAG: DUF3108 domain-containing protein [Gammaproteobacteria bacterium]|nr:DUF3108 domain-containing protein [Gammaproteobacteria bacterium]